MLGPIARILLRVVVGALIARAWIDPQIGHSLVDDPDFAMLIEMLLAGIVWGATELWYVIAKRMGWAT